MLVLLYIYNSASDLCIFFFFDYVGFLYQILLIEKP